MFSIVICTMGCIDYLSQTFDVILRNKDITQVIIVDNTLDNSTFAFLDKIKSDKLVVIRNKTNQGVIKSRNQGLALSRGEYTLILDDDQVPVKGNHTFDQYKALLGKYDILGCEAQIMDFNTGLTRLGNKNKFTYVGAGGMCMKTSLWRKLGMFDEVFQPAYFEDPDICLRAKKEGHSIGLVADHGIFHYAHQTLFRSDLGFNHDKVMLRNRKIFMGRYGISARAAAKKTSLTSTPKKRILHILSNIDVGGVQQNAAYIAKGLSNDETEMAIYVAEAGSQGEFEKHVGKDVKVFYNKRVALDKTIKIYKNVSHRPQHVTNNVGASEVVKPGGTLADRGFNLQITPSFKLDGSTTAEVNVTIVDVVIKYKPDVIHYHRDVSRISRDIKRLKAMPQFKNLKVVRSVHGSTLPNLDNYDKAILLTKAAKRGAAKRYPKIDGSFIPNGIDTGVFRPIPCDKENICITHTRLSKILKLTARPDIYFEIVRRVCDLDKSVKFVLVGPDYGIYKERFDTFINKYSLQEKLIIKPPMYHEELVKYINKAKVWVYPMREDNFPLAVIEAMLCKLPIVTTNLVGISEMITNEDNGLLSAPDDIDTFVGNVIRCLKDASLSDKLGLNAYKRAIENYSLSSMLKNYSEMYTKLIGG